MVIARSYTQLHVAAYTIDVDLIHRVNQIVEAVVATIVMPSFRTLQPEDIHSKDTPGDPDDLVTIVDKSAERYLIDALAGVVPGAAFIGEEAACENPTLLDALSAREPAWLIDPIDGTKNFARGSADFGVMLALVEGGRTRAHPGWQFRPHNRPATSSSPSAEAARGSMARQ
jgi:fructose-1,6-bisphosphatase/inositol monophosphatase family enzyme